MTKPLLIPIAEITAFSNAYDDRDDDGYISAGDIYTDRNSTEFNVVSWDLDSVEKFETFFQAVTNFRSQLFFLEGECVGMAVSENGRPKNLNMIVFYSGGKRITVFKHVFACQMAIHCGPLLKTSRLFGPTKKEKTAYQEARGDYDKLVLSAALALNDVSVQEELMQRMADVFFKEGPRIPLADVLTFKSHVERTGSSCPRYQLLYENYKNK